MELSLDEIIKKSKGDYAGGAKKKFTKVDSKFPLRKTLNKPTFKESTRHVSDARTKIIQKNRAKIIDAREKLMEVTKIRGDARRLIENRRTSSSSNGTMLNRNNVQNISYRNGRSPRQPIRDLLMMRDVKPLVREIRPAPIYTRHARLPGVPPRGYVDYDNMAQYEAEEYVAARGLISRTVRNDVAPPPLPRRTERITRMDYSPTRSEPSPPPPPRRLNSWNSQNSEHYDPFDVYERHERRLTPPPKELPPPPPKGILRTASSRASPDIYQRRYMAETPTHLSYEMRSRLESAPDPHLSAGIFSSQARNMPHSSTGYRIVVSNLHPSVTQSDIRELFEDIGPLYESRIVRPGVAEVIYKSLDDAEKAVDTYHNRQLDHQPMKCLLVNPRASDKPTAPAMQTSSSSSRLASGKTPLEIDIDALHKVLFRRH